MTTTEDGTRLNECACGCGALVKGKWARGHWARAQKANRELQPLPGPDDPEPDEDEELPAELVAELDDMDRLAWITDTPARPDDEGEPGEVPPDPPAGKIPPPSRAGGPGGTGRKRATATVQRDVQAKIRMLTMPAARVWAVRDKVCGPVAIEQEPEIAAAFANIVCDSADLLNWFTGPAAGYMKYFELLMAVWPLLMVVWLHHVAHAQQMMVPNPQQPPQQAYAA